MCSDNSSDFIFFIFVIIIKSTTIGLIVIENNDNFVLILVHWLVFSICNVFL